MGKKKDHYDEMTKIMMEVDSEDQTPESPPTSIETIKSGGSNEKDAPEGHETAEKLIEESKTDEEKAAEVVAKDKKEKEEESVSKNKDKAGNAESSGEIAAAQEAIQEAKEQVDKDESIPHEKKKEEADKLAQQLYKVKIDGVEKEVTEEELISGYQKSTAAYKKFEEAAKIKKESEERTHMAQELVKLLKEDPRSLLLHPEIGHSREDVRKLAEEFLTEELQREAMTPEQRELEELRAKLKKQEEEKTRAEIAERNMRIETQKQRLSTEWTAKIKEILPKYNLPASPRTVAQMAVHKERALEHGVELSWDEAAKLVRDDFNSWQKELYGSLEGEELVKVLGQGVAEKLRKATLAKVKPATSAPPTSSTPSAPKSSKSKEDEKKQKRYARDVLDEIKKEYGVE